jgi:hypothetical protein
MNGILVKLKAVELLRHFARLMRDQFTKFDEETEEDCVFFLAIGLQPFYYLPLGELGG